MTLTRRPSPFSELVTLRQAMDRLFDDGHVDVLGLHARQGRLDQERVRGRPDVERQVKPRQIQIRPVTAGEASAVETDSAAGPVTADAPRT